MLSENLRDHLSSLSIESKIVSPGSPECIQSIKRVGMREALMGCVKIKGYHFNQIGVIVRTIRAPRGVSSARRAHMEVSDPIDNFRLVADDPLWEVACVYSYLIDIPPGDLRKELNVKIDTIKKGLFNKETIDYEWKGGALANRLNTDAVLMMKIRNLKHTLPDRILTKLEFPWMKVESLKEDDFITLRQLVHDPLDLPTRDNIEIADMVSKHIRTMIQGI